MLPNVFPETPRGSNEAAGDLNTRGGGEGGRTHLEIFCRCNDKEKNAAEGRDSLKVTWCAKVREEGGVLWMADEK